MNNLYLIDNGNFILLATNLDESRVFPEIRAWLRENEIPCDYIRSWETSNGRKYDFGSWSRFFHWGKEPDYATED